MTHPQVENIIDVAEEFADEPDGVREIVLTLASMLPDSELHDGLVSECEDAIPGLRAGDLSECRMA